MQKFISKYGLAAHLAILAVAPLFLFPFLTAFQTGIVLLWLSLIGAVWVVMEPSRLSKESLHEARKRSSGNIVRDPLFWCMLVMVLFAAVRCANGGVARMYDPDLEDWILRSPSLENMPGCVDGCGFLPFAVTVAVLVILTGCRNALGKAARVSFLCISSVLAGIAALVSVGLLHSGSEIVCTSTGCSVTGTSFFGSAYGIFLLAGVSSLAGAFELRWNKFLLFLVLAIGGSLAGLYFFAPTYIILVYLAAALLLLVISVGYAGIVNGGSEAFKCVSVILMAVLIPALCILWVRPEGLDEARLAIVETGKIFPNNFESLREILSRISMESWFNHKWLGTGLGSFPLNVNFIAKPDDWAALSAAGIYKAPAAPLNGWWLLLVERGLVGAIALGLVLMFLLATYLRRLVLVFISHRRVMIPVAVAGPIAMVAIVAETYVDTSFLRPEIMMMAAAVCAVSACSLPLPRKKDKAVDAKVEEEK